MKKLAAEQIQKNLLEKLGCFEGFSREIEGRAPKLSAEATS